MTINAARRARPRSAAGARHFDFRFDQPARYLLAALGVTPATDVGAEGLRIWYGPRRLSVDRRNVPAASVTAPLSAWRAIGPRLSLADCGATFGATTRAGVCVALWQPVAALAPRWLLTYPAVTLTVDRPVELARLLRRGQAKGARKQVMDFESLHLERSDPAGPFLTEQQVGKAR